MSKTSELMKQNIFYKSFKRGELEPAGSKVPAAQDIPKATLSAQIEGRCSIKVFSSLGAIVFKFFYLKK